MIPSQWFSVLLDYDRASEFTGDDVNQYSAVCDLGGAYEFVTVICPIMDSGDVTIYIQKTVAITEIPALMHVLDYDATGSLVQTSATVSTAAIALTFAIGGAQYFRLRTSGDQDQNITYYARGFNRD